MNLRVVVHCLRELEVCVDEVRALVISGPEQIKADDLNAGPPPSSPDVPAEGQHTRGEPEPGVGVTPPSWACLAQPLGWPRVGVPEEFVPQPVPDPEVFPLPKVKMPAQIHFRVR